MNTHHIGAIGLALFLATTGPAELPQGAAGGHPSPPPNEALSAGPASGNLAAADAFDIPEPIEPVQLAALLHDRPRDYVVIDVRPSWQYREYHVPGAVNIDPRELVAHVKSLPKSARPVFVDRDGTVAWALGGAVSAVLRADAAHAGPGLVRVLAGGTARFWREVEIPGRSLTDVPGARAAPEAATSPATTAPKPATTKRSAGC